MNNTIIFVFAVRNRIERIMAMENSFLRDCNEQKGLWKMGSGAVSKLRLFLAWRQKVLNAKYAKDSRRAQRKAPDEPRCDQHPINPAAQASTAIPIMMR
ncbi:MAG: hypothetical protein WCB94_14510 [Terriglobales bacterium]